MNNSALRRYAVFVALCALGLFINGPAVTNDAAKPLVGFGQSHAWLGGLVSLLSAVLAVWLSRAKAEPWLVRLGWTAFGLSLTQGLLVLAPDTPPVAVRIAHAVLAQIYFVTIAVIAAGTSTAVSRTPVAVENGPRLRMLASRAPWLVLVQVTLGAVHRHGVIGSMLHIAWALVVALFIGVAMALLLATERPEVKAVCTAMSIFLGMQLLLGFALLTLQALDADPAAITLVTGVHAATGALTFATSAVVAIRIPRLISDAAAVPTE